MKRKTKSGDEPVGVLTRAVDFLPPPEALIPARETTKVTIRLDTGSVDFFRKKARQMGRPYQRVMREVLREYAHHYAA